jgi:hypothetical protein
MSFWRGAHGTQREVVHTRHGSVHTFRNTGETAGRMPVFVAPAGLERYPEEISAFSVPKDIAKVPKVSKRCGITFL